MKSDWWYWYPTAFSVWGDEERHAWNVVQKSGRYTMGDRVAEFEEAFAKWHGRKYATMCNSGSSANLLMIAALFHKTFMPLKRGNTALVPAIAWATTYAPLVQHNLRLRLMDCDDTWNANTIGEVSPGRVETSASLVVGCSILGNPARLDELQTQAVAADAYFIEDNCESFGAKLKAQAEVDTMPPITSNRLLCGNYGFMSSFSFFYSHQISAIEGGMVLTDDKEMATLCRMLRAHGWSRDIEAPAHFDNEYDFRVFGYNLRPLELHAAIANVQLRKQHEHKRLRQKNVKLFRDMTQGLPIRHPEPYGEMNPFGLAFTVENGKRSGLVRALRAASIDCRLPTGGSFRMHHYSRGIADLQETPVADNIHRCGLFLGNGPLDLSDRIEKAVAIMKDVLHDP